MINSIDEAIAHCHEKAEELKKQGSICCDSLEDTIRAEKCLECAKEHEQLAEWLEELKAVKDIIDHWNDENSSFVSATIAFEKILDVFKESEAENETDN